MKPCKIAVIVPVHNAAAFLTACTDAIAAQKFDGFPVHSCGRRLHRRLPRALRCHRGGRPALCGAAPDQQRCLRGPHGGCARGAGTGGQMFASATRTICTTLSFWTRCMRRRRTAGFRWPAAGTIPLPTPCPPTRPRPATARSCEAPPIWTRCCMTMPWITACGTSCSPRPADRGDARQRAGL